MSMTAREEIQERMALYARALDAKNYEGIADCFAADVRVEYSGFSQVMNCRDEVMAHMRKALEPLAVTQHLFTNFIIELDGECDFFLTPFKGGFVFSFPGK